MNVGSSRGIRGAVAAFNLPKTVVVLWDATS